MKKTYFLLAIVFLQAVINLSSAQCDCPNDNQAPILTSFSGNHTVNCDVDFYDYLPEFWDNCDNDIQIDLSVDTVFIDARRWLRDAYNVGDPDFTSSMTLILPGLDPDYNSFVLDYGGIEYQSDEGTALLEGHVNAINDADAGFDFHLELMNRMNADEWLNQGFPTNYKDDLSVVVDEYLTWDYYMLNSNSYISGTGRFLGSYIALSHAPPNGFYAWQEGVMANGRSLNNGAGGWAICEGYIFLDAFLFPVDPNGFSASFHFDFEDCLIPQYTLTWTGSDDCGNSTSYSHVLTTSVNSPTGGNCPCGVFGCINEDAENYDPYATLSIGQCYGCSGDFNGDGVINSGDLVSFLADFGCMSDCLYDINQDGTTNTGDLTLLLTSIGEDCE